MGRTIIGIYDNEDYLISALKKMKEENIEVHEVYTPYPVHEVFKLLKRKTRIPLAAFTFALIGLGFSYSYLYYTSVISYPLIYGGKPLHSIPSFIVIAFVSMISLSVLLSFIFFLIRTRLYPGKRPTIIEARGTDDAFVVVIDHNEGMSTDEEDRIQSVLKKSKAVEVKVKEI
ncbi:MAG: DUF3341 domain-containing protein [Saprospiraceae bacterium]|nr:DUF3341 domain-containing protein [Saprospiraceae bacterium]